MSETRKWLVFAGILVGMTAATIEKSIVATALPTITEEIGGLTLYSWVFGAYMLASTITIPLFSKLADLKGRRPLYVGGMIIFLTGTFLAATATSMTQLILYRLIQGTGAGAVAPAALAAIGDIFPHKTRGRAFGIIGAVSILANLAGPLLGGWVTDQLSWRWGFLLILPIGLLATVMVTFGYPAHSVTRKALGPIDWQGAGLMGLALSFGLVGVQMMGEGSRMLGLGAALLVGSAFVFWAGLHWEKRHPDPALPLPLLRDPLMKSILIGTLFLGAVTHSTIAYLPLFVQGLRGGSATEAGLTLLPMLLAAGLASGVGGWLSSRIPRQTTITAWALAVIAFLLFVLAQFKPDILIVFVASGLVGVGMGLLLPIFLDNAQEIAGEADRGVASGAVQLARNLGGAAGVPLLGVWIVASAELAPALLAIFLCLLAISAAGLLLSIFSARSYA